MSSMFQSEDMYVIVEQTQVALHQEFLHFKLFLAGGAATPQRAVRVEVSHE
jgi:hypothetical protein